MNLPKIAYYGSTGLFTLMLSGGVAMYLFNNAEVALSFGKLGFPTWLIYPMAAAKTLGLLVIWIRKSKVLTGMAYAGFFFNLSLAVMAHLAVSDGEFFGAAIALSLLSVSWFSKRKVEAQVPGTAGEQPAVVAAAH